jgi:hypothetical protein
MPAKPLDDKALVYRIDVPCETCSAGIGEPCAPDREENAGNVPEALDDKIPVLRLTKQVKDLEAKVAFLGESGLLRLHTWKRWPSDHARGVRAGRGVVSRRFALTRPSAHVRTHLLPSSAAGS